MDDHQPDPVDLYVGQMIRAQRRLREVSQQVLADAVGTSFQQIQKYERGANRVSASRLAQIAFALKVPVATFFPPELGEGLAPAFSVAGQLTASQGGMELAGAYLMMDGHQRSAVLNVARVIAGYVEKTRAADREAA